MQYGDVYMLEDGKEWKELPPMPKPNSHIECAWVLVNNSIIVVGGTTLKHPITKKMILVGEVFQFNLATLVSNPLCCLLLLLKLFLLILFNIPYCTLGVTLRKETMLKELQFILLDNNR